MTELVQIFSGNGYIVALANIGGIIGLVTTLFFSFRFVYRIVLQKGIRPYLQNSIRIWKKRAFVYALDLHIYIGNLSRTILVSILDSLMMMFSMMVLVAIALTDKPVPSFSKVFITASLCFYMLNLFYNLTCAIIMILYVRRIRRKRWLVNRIEIHRQYGFHRPISAPIPRVNE